MHPAQRSLAKGKKNGPVSVLGGTGKTVVAMHQAKWLACRELRRQRPAW